MNKFIHLVATALGIIFLTLLLPANMLFAVPPPSSAPLAADSVIVDIRRGREKADQAVRERLMPKLDAVSAAIGSANQTVKAAYDAHQANPSTATAAAFNEAVATGLDQIAATLSGFADESRSVIPAVDELGAALHKAAITFTEKVGDYKARARARQVDVKRLDDALREIATRYSEQIKSKQGLPPEVEFRTRELAQAKAFLEMRQQALDKAAEQLGGFVGSLGSYDLIVQRYRGEYALLHSSARYALGFIGDLSRIHADSVELGAVIGEVRAIGKELAGIQAGMEAVHQGLRDIAASPPITGLDPEAVPDGGVKLGPATAAELLTPYLTEKDVARGR